MGKAARALIPLRPLRTERNQKSQKTARFFRTLQIRRKSNMCSPRERLGGPVHPHRRHRTATVKKRINRTTTRFLDPAHAFRGSWTPPITVFLRTDSRLTPVLTRAAGLSLLRGLLLMAYGAPFG